MTEDIEPTSGNLPAVLAAPNPERDPGEGGLRPATPAPSKLDQIVEAVLNALTPQDFGRMTQDMCDLASVAKSEPTRVAAAKLIYDRFVPDNLEQKHRDAEERNDAIIEIKQLLADLAAAKLDGDEAPHAVAQNGAQGADHAEGA